MGLNVSESPCTNSKSKPEGETVLDDRELETKSEMESIVADGQPRIQA